MSDALFAAERAEMVEVIAVYAACSRDRTGRGEIGERVMRTMAKVPRHEFVPAELRHMAYADSPLPIGCEKTISQPFMVAIMTDLLELQPTDRVLEVGTGLGYQSAVLAELAAKVYTVEIIRELADEARRRLTRLGYGNIEMRIGDGAQGWLQQAPFDKIIVTAAPDLVPPALLQQLKPGGRMVVPAGIEQAQQLMLVVKESGRTRIRELMPVRFSTLVPAH